ncbi:MAG TPA: hypothetical protein P5572_07175 [Phycisphaerae bacterium]|nr:hypothetical protein [Phycisphaerae bacterium]
MNAVAIANPPIPAGTPSDRTNLADISETLRSSLADYLAGRSSHPEADAERDAALAELRARGQQQVLHDLDANIADIEGLYAEVCSKRDLHAVDLPVERDLLGRLHDLRAQFRAADPYSSAKVEEVCWILVQQFYCDAIDCAQRLLVREAGGLPAPGTYDEDGRVLRQNVMGITARTRRQALMNAVEVAVPNPLETRVTRTFAPTLLHMLWHQFVPWGELWWHDFEKTTLGWLGENGFSRLRGERRRVVRVEGQEHLRDNAEIYDAAARRIRHNVVIAASHRLGFMDFPFFADVLRDVPHIVWANNSFYTPGMAKKLARSRSAIPVRGVGRMPFSDAIDLTIRVFTEDGLPLFIMSDGATKNMQYGQYLRVKRGVRVLVDECVRRHAGTGRRTFVVPMTFDDPFAYLFGLEDEIVVRVHPPIEVTEPTSPEAHTSVFDESAFNGGDALLNQLEAIYFAHSLQARAGLWQPRVVAAARAWRAEHLRGLRGWARRRWNMSVYDLCRLTARAAMRGGQSEP